MCKLSDKLKLCICEVDEEQSLSNFWVLNRGKKQREMIIGEMGVPPHINIQDQIFNRKLLQQLLNSGEGFDVPMAYQENDVLHLFFSVPEKKYFETHIAYSFIFLKGKWRTHNPGTFETWIDPPVKGVILAPF